MEYSPLYNGRCFYEFHHDGFPYEHNRPDEEGDELIEEHRHKQLQVLLQTILQDYQHHLVKYSLSPYTRVCFRTLFHQYDGHCSQLPEQCCVLGN